MDKIDLRTPKKRRSNVVLPKNAEERAVALIDVTERLIAVINRETEMLSRPYSPADLGQVADKKQPLSFAFDELSRLLRIDRDGMANLAPELKDRLTAMTEALVASATINAEALSIAVKTQKIVAETLVASINLLRDQQPGLSYDPTDGGGRALQGHGSLTRGGPTTSAMLNASF